MNATKTTAHSNCQHASTKAARAQCRRQRSTVKTVTTEYGTFEIKVIKAKEIKKTDMVLWNPETLRPFFSGVTYDAFQMERFSRETMRPEKTDTYRLALGGPDKMVPGDTEFTVAVDPQAVKTAIWEHRRNMFRR
ncbi:hypothetical protein SEA_ZUKO_92 [Streptomyces phage Zuko]|uniref:Uncharacterized protein n=1 Tax=Streptomyces phage Zuko TaxID=2601695 RepID=A0A5J6D757_9CAUD|nr:hypothetical protein PP630_gp092 [Streptomyces phage Zuko]QEQ93670.1 hypothetical protein SEA_ZUKO_92 [Streptomyces phage Zuko]